jgi:hypothetical protein
MRSTDDPASASRHMIVVGKGDLVELNLGRIADRVLTSR